MADETTTQATPAPDTQETATTTATPPKSAPPAEASSEDLSALIKELQAEGINNPGAFLRGYKRVKEENSELKALRQRASILDELERGGIKPEELPDKLKSIKAQQEQEEALQKRIVELQAQERAERERLEQQYLEKLQKTQQQVVQYEKQRALEQVLAASGAPMDVYDDFSAIAGRYIEFDENNKVKSFKNKAGDTLYVEDNKTGGVRLATKEDFIVAAKKGEYGLALQSILPAFNQSSGSGIPSSGGTGPDGMLTFTRSEMDDPEWQSRLTPEQLEKVRKRQYRVI